MPEEGPVLDPARRARSMLVTACNVEVGILDKRLLLEAHVVDGSGAVVIPGRCVARACLLRLLAGEPAPPVDVVALDVASVPQPDRLRGVLRLTGRPELCTDRLPPDAMAHLRVGPPDPVIRIVPTDVVLDWRVERASDSRPVPVPAPLFAGARPDGLVEWEGPWASHLAAHHDSTCLALARRVEQVDDDVMVRPVLADEGGVVVRVYRPEGVRDLRVPFPRRVACPCEATSALELMLTP